MAYSGGGDAAEWLVPKAMWLARHEPQIYAGAEVICECIDYINFMLTGRWVGSRMNATCKWNYDSVAGTLRRRSLCGVRRARSGRQAPASRSFPVGAPIERLSAAAAAHLGLSNRPVLAQGGIDAHIGMAGADTMAPGELLLIGGTSTVQLFQLPGGIAGRRFLGALSSRARRRSLARRGRTGLGRLGAVLAVSRHVRAGRFRRSTGSCTRRRRCPVGGAGVLALDYFMGNRTPYRDPLLRGAFLGLSLGHDRAALYRAAVEGVALASANVLKRMGELGVACRRVVSSGGYAKNPLWLRATVDAMGLPIADSARGQSDDPRRGGLRRDGRGTRA